MAAQIVADHSARVQIGRPNALLYEIVAPAREAIRQAGLDPAVAVRGSEIHRTAVWRANERSAMGRYVGGFLEIERHKISNCEQATQMIVGRVRR